MLLTFGSAPVFAGGCVDSPGPGRGPQAKLDPGGEGEDKKAKFDKPPQSQVHLKLLDGPLAKIAKKCGADLEVNSGYRNCRYNAGVGSGSGSQHPKGNATDIKFCKGKSLAEMFKILAQAGCGGIGCYPTFVQCDIGPKRQWGPCPGQRPPPDDPNDDKKDITKPDTAYDSKTPEEPPAMAGGGAPSGGSSSSPSTISARPEPLNAPASYPTAMTSTRSNGVIPDMRDNVIAPKKLAAKGAALENISAITNKNDPLLFSAISGGSAYSITDASGTSGLSGSTAKGPESAKANSSGSRGGGGAGLSDSGASAAKKEKNDKTEGVQASGSTYSAGSGGVAGFSGGKGGSANQEAIANFGKGLGAAQVAMSGSDTEAAIRDIQEQEFQGAGDREVASVDEHDGSGIGGRNGASLFERSHAALVFCQKRGCVSMGGR